MLSCRNASVAVGSGSELHEPTVVEVYRQGYIGFPLILERSRTATTVMPPFHRVPSKVSETDRSPHQILATKTLERGTNVMMQTCTLSLIVFKDSDYTFSQQGDNCFAAGTGIFQFRSREGMEFATIPFSARNQPALLLEAQTSNKVLCTCKGYITFEENIPLFNIEDAEIQTETAPVPEAGSDEKPLSEVGIQPSDQQQPEVAPVARVQAETESKPTAKSRRKQKSTPQNELEKQPKSEAISQPEEFENSFDTAAALDESEYIHVPF